MSIKDFAERNPYYLDGITKVTDPFWNIECTCGNRFLSCICNGKCPVCGRVEGKRMLGEKTLEEIIAERGNPIPLKEQNQSLSE